MSFQGYVQIYTGNGKGKTTAALGQALRAAGAGMRTFIIQFLKKGDYSELAAIKKFLPEMIQIEQFGLPCFHHKNSAVSVEELQAARQGLDRAMTILKNPQYHLLILDEINTLLYFKILPLKDILDLIKQRPSEKELILTGRYAPAELIAYADLVSEVLEIKHYFRRGILARKGIEN